MQNTRCNSSFQLQETKMKFYAAVLLMFITLVWTAQVHDDGQPGCKTEEELLVGEYRNTWDPTRYWVCEELDVPARVVKCLGGQGWLDSKKKCVDWDEWQWEEPSHPPSKP